MVSLATADHVRQTRRKLCNFRSQVATAMRGATSSAPVTPIPPLRDGILHRTPDDEYGVKASAVAPQSTVQKDDAETLVELSESV